MFCLFDSVWLSIMANQQLCDSFRKKQKEQRKTRKAVWHACVSFWSDRCYRDLFKHEKETDRVKTKYRAEIEKGLPTTFSFLSCRMALTFFLFCVRLSRVAFVFLLRSSSVTGQVESPVRTLKHRWHIRLSISDEFRINVDGKFDSFADSRQCDKVCQEERN